MILGCIILTTAALGMKLYNKYQEKELYKKKAIIKELQIHMEQWELKRMIEEKDYKGKKAKYAKNIDSYQHTPYHNYKKTGKIEFESPKTWTQWFKWWEK